ncbi:MAG: phosphoribosylformylglycinamidine synthase subunit PurQ [Deltaproteobacteria bacterium]|nr:phosphoribosylformylglycinamidine synthase subunit PurQ [Deltaproteobacteria bacterium]
MIRALVLTGFGINCEEELAAAWRLAGAEPHLVHLNRLLAGQERIRDHHVVSLPGGFSFGDDLGAGRVLANRIRYRTLPSGGTLLDELSRFVQEGGYVLGICNGFQVLVQTGLLPNVGGGLEPEATLAPNASGRFEDRWIRCVATTPSPTPFLAGVSTLDLPVRHGEGRLVFRDDEVQTRVVERGLACLRYADSEGLETHVYPANPNGSALACAGMVDVSGHVFGLMPHPEAYLSAWNHPDWGRRIRLSGHAMEDGEGLALFRNLVRHLTGEVKP